jgi:hypothetical protein
VFDSFRFGVGDTVAVAARGVACGGLAEVEEMAEGEALGAVLDEGEDEWDLREGCSVQRTLPVCENTAAPMTFSAAVYPP